MLLRWIRNVASYLGVPSADHWRVTVALRTESEAHQDLGRFRTVSRESFILGNNVLLAVSTLMILLGTIYPLIYEAATGGLKISVGPPYFNTFFFLSWGYSGVVDGRSRDEMARD